MTGIEDFNFPAFFAAEEKLEARGFAVFNPARRDGGDTSKTWHYYLRRDIPELCRCDLVVVLPGWRGSRGANVEVAVAQMIDIPVIDFTTMQPLGAESVCLEAERITQGKRNQDYGHPLEDFTKQARMWSVILGTEVTAEQIALCMIAVKISREMHRPARDNRVDICGYARTLQMIAERRALDVAGIGNDDDKGGA